VKKTLSIFVILLIVAGSLQAAVIVQTHNIETHGPGSSLDPWNDTWSFDKFDTQGGIFELTSVRVEFDIYAWGGQIGSDNDGTTTANGSISLDVNGLLSANSVGLLNSSFQNIWASLLVRQLDTLALDVDDEGLEGYQTGGDDWNLLEGPTEANANSSTADDYIADAVKGGYIGTDTFSMSFTSSQTQNVLSGGDVESIISPQTAKGDVTIIYDYVVPEPAAIGLLSLGGILTLVVSRFRRRNA